ncbi:hypothetical protein [Burkholderia ubonensis]|uniref:hypothetical protein n=1 Tax=Burkholderia ubonensis TaxID=101571 RepID=UPI0007521ACC|nr:hypothetical protein [Burkholderia ubonensis]KVQ34423.1 hypothetical protein WK00_01810 [Burkholderia ubonensis]
MNYTGMDKGDEMKCKPVVVWAAKRGKFKTMQARLLNELVIAASESRCRSVCEPKIRFGLFHHRRVSYTKLAKNTSNLFILFALANLVIARNLLHSGHGSKPSCS